MSSLRNAVQRRNHRERAQPLERSKWGILEKSKDYKLRATDHKQKKRKIKALKDKASTRNEDEFYFGMMNSSTHGGVKRAKRGEENSGGGGKILDLDVVKLLKTQDQGYMQTALQKTRKERERMAQAVALQETGVDVLPSSKRIMFDDDGEIENAPGQFVDDEDAAEDDEDMDDLGDLDGFDFDASSLEDLDVDTGEESGSGDEEKVDPEQRRVRRLKQRALEVKRKKLAALENQERKLGQALDRLDHQRAKMNGTVGGVNKRGVKFRIRHRKR